MRQIKFRAWDDELKQMFYSNTEQFDDSLSFRFGHFETENPVYMQYTGLRDKNGKEIYEGDIIYTKDAKYIVRFGKYRDYKHESVCMTAFSQEHMGFYLEKYYSFEGWLDSLQIPLPYIETHACELKGNEFENPELLNL